MRRHADRLPYFLLDRHLDRMMVIVTDLGEDLANRTPGGRGVNSPYALVVHCCGMAQWWVQEAILGHPVDRDREAEFVATGSLSSLASRVAAVRRMLLDALPLIDLDAAPLGGDLRHYTGTPIAEANEGVLLHVLEELAQHHGHLELTRDWLVGAGG